MSIPCTVCYGIDVSGSRVVVVRSMRSGKDITHETRFSGAPGDVDTVAQNIRGEVDENRAAVAAALPVQDSTTRWLSTPFPSVQKARKVLPSILDVQLPFPLEHCVYGFPALEASENGTIRALAVVGRVTDVEQRLEQLQGVGFDPVILDHEGLALWTQGQIEMPAAPDTLRVIAYAGYDRTVLVIGRGSEYRGSYGSRYGWSPVLDARISDEVPGVTDLLARIRLVLRTHVTAVAEQGAIDWVWVGPGAEAGSAIQHVEERLSLPRKGRTAQEPSTFLCRALCTRALQDGLMRWNFRLDTRSHSQFRAWVYARCKRVAVTYLVAGLLLCALNIGWLAHLHYRDARAQSRLEEQARAIAGSERLVRGQEMLVAERAKTEQDALSAPFRKALDPRLTTLLHEVLRTTRETGLAIESLSLREGEIWIRGFTDDWDRVDLFSERFQMPGWEVSVDRQDALMDERVRYQITMVETL